MAAMADKPGDPFFSFLYHKSLIPLCTILAFYLSLLVARLTTGILFKRTWKRTSLCAHSFLVICNVVLILAVTVKYIVDLSAFRGLCLKHHYEMRDTSIGAITISVLFLIIVPIVTVFLIYSHDDICRKRGTKPYPVSQKRQRYCSMKANVGLILMYFLPLLCSQAKLPDGDYSKIEDGSGPYKKSALQIPLSKFSALFVVFSVFGWSMAFYTSYWFILSFRSISPRVSRFIWTPVRVAKILRKDTKLYRAWVGSGAPPIYQATDDRTFAVNVELCPPQYSYQPGRPRYTASTLDLIREDVTTNGDPLPRYESIRLDRHVSVDEGLDTIAERSSVRAEEMV